MSGNSREQNKEKIKKLLGTIIHYNNKLDKKISFNLENILSAGNFAVIVRAKCIEGNDIIKSNEIYALKFLFKNQKQTNAIDYLREKTILYDLYGLYKKNKEINYIMKLFGDFELSKNGDDYYILITEFCQGINLENIIYQCNLLNQYLDEILVLKILKQLLECLNFLHNKCHIIHRDIKPDNIILGNDNNIKLIDFGLSAYLEKDDTNEDTSFLVSRKSVKGCAQFTAPEILYCVSNR
jgi:serine/threonine protein kinase